MFNRLVVGFMAVAIYCSLNITNSWAATCSGADGNQIEINGTMNCDACAVQSGCKMCCGNKHDGMTGSGYNGCVNSNNCNSKPKKLCAIGTPVVFSSALVFPPALVFSRTQTANRWAPENNDTIYCVIDVENQLRAIAPSDLTDFATSAAQ